MSTKKRNQRKRKTLTIISTPQGNLIPTHVDKLGNNVGPFMIMNVNQFLDLLRNDENEGAE